MKTSNYRRESCAAIFVAALAILIVGIAQAPAARAAGANLLVNGDLAKGSEHQPDDWRTEAWLNDPDAFSYDWTHPADGGPGELKVVAIKANDARWMQSLSLQPGWYHITAEVRTEKVGTQATGASISMMEDGIMSADIRGTSGWQPVGLYLKVGGQGADVQIALARRRLRQPEYRHGIFPQRAGREDRGAASGRGPGLRSRRDSQGRGTSAHWTADHTGRGVRNSGRGLGLWMVDVRSRGAAAQTGPTQPC